MSFRCLNNKGKDKASDGAEKQLQANHRYLSKYPPQRHKIKRKLLLWLAHRYDNYLWYYVLTFLLAKWMVCQGCLSFKCMVLGWPSADCFDGLGGLSAVYLCIMSMESNICKEINFHNFVYVLFELPWLHSQSNTYTQFKTDLLIGPTQSKQTRQTAGVNVVKLFFFIGEDKTKYARVFVPGIYFPILYKIWW